MKHLSNGYCKTELSNCELLALKNKSRPSIGDCNCLYHSNSNDEIPYTKCISLYCNEDDLIKQDCDNSFAHFVCSTYC